MVVDFLFELYVKKGGMGILIYLILIMKIVGKSKSYDLILR